MKYGWIPQLADHRDRMYRAARKRPLPRMVDLRPSMPPVLDQGDIGSCTANAIAAADMFLQVKQGLADAFLPSRLFIYWNERAMEGTILSDSGAVIRDGIKSVAKFGVCPETEWPYIPAKFADRPPLPCYLHAYKHQALEYFALEGDLYSLKSCLTSGYPFVFGFSVYESFEDAEVAGTGIMRAPTANERLMGGHAVVAAGYDDSTQRFIIQNSWGASWGDRGFFTMPYEIIARGMASDFWTIRLVEDGK
jgi:C1A family cysteine protease